MWPFKPKAARASRSVPTLPFIDGAAWAQLGGTTTSTITVQQAESLAAVLSSVNAVSGTIGSLPAFITKADDSRAEVPDHPLQRLINFGTDENTSWSDFLESLLASALLRGNGLAEIETDTRGRLTALHVLPWPQITPWLDDNGTLMFDYLATTPPGAGKRRRLMRSDCLHLKDRADHIIGVSRLARAGGALSHAFDLQRSAFAFNNNAVRPSGIVSMPTHLSDEVRGRLKQEFDQAYSGAERGRTVVLSGGATFSTLNLLSAEDMAIVAQRNFSVADIARIFNVPPFILADPSRSTFASSREASRMFAMQALSPWVMKLERCFAQSVLSGQYKLVIDLSSLTKADTEAHFAALLRGRQGGWLSPNDCRAETGWPRSKDPTADSIEPPVAGGRAPGDVPTGDQPSPAPPPDDGGESDKIARLDQRRDRHA